MTRGVWILGEDEVIGATVKKSKQLGIKVGGELTDTLPFEMTLIVEPGTRVPWDLLPAAWNFLVRWDAAVPLWVYGTLATGVGSKRDREITQAVVRDLRVLLHAVELIFVRRNEDGQKLVDEYAAQLDRGDDKRLAFLRAMYIVKPRLCVLPTTWTKGTSQAIRTRNRGALVARQPKSKPAANGLITVEIEPGRLVKIHAGDEEKARAQFERQKNPRGR